MICAPVALLYPENRCRSHGHRSNAWWNSFGLLANLSGTHQNVECGVKSALLSGREVPGEDPENRRPLLPSGGAVIRRAKFVTGELDSKTGAFKMGCEWSSLGLSSV